MPTTKDQILAALNTIILPGGDSLIHKDMVRAVAIDGGTVRFVIEAPTPEEAAQMGSVRTAAQAVVSQLDGVTDVSVVLTAHGPAAKPAPP